MSEVLILLDVDKIIFNNFDYYISSHDFVKSKHFTKDELIKLPPNFKYTVYYPYIVDLIKRWHSQNYEIRWLIKPSVGEFVSCTSRLVSDRVLDDEYKIATLLFDLPEFKVCDVSKLTSEDLSRPIVLFTKKYYSINSNNYMWTYRSSNNDTDIDYAIEINNFINDIKLYTFQVALLSIDGSNNNIYNKSISQYRKNSHNESKCLNSEFGTINCLNSESCAINCLNNELPVVDISIQGYFKNFDDLREFLINHNKIKPYIQHLQSHLNSISIDSGSDRYYLINNNVLNTMKRICNLIVLIFPSQNFLPKPHPNPCPIILNKTPIIWLDVDGVINATSKKFKDEFEDAITISYNLNLKNFLITYSPSVIQAINRWSEVAEIRWLTSWTHEARYGLAPLLELHDFSVAGLYKLQLLKKECHNQEDLNRPMVWIDDEVANNRLCDIVSNKVLIVKPDYFLTRSEISYVDTFLAQFY
jgi:hypothetical protein